MHGLVLALHHDARLLHSKDSVARGRAGFAQLIDAHRATAGGPKATPSNTTAKSRS
jgi:hypothetical protein